MVRLASEETYMTKDEENGTSTASQYCQNLPSSNLNIYSLPDRKKPHSKLRRRA